MTPTEVVLDYFRERMPLDERGEAIVREVMHERSVREGEFLQRAGEIAKHGHFVTRGCLRSYSIDERGREHTLYFAPERWWITDLESIRDQVPSTRFIQALEDTELVILDWPSHDRLVATIPGFAAAFAVGLQKVSASRERRILSGLSETAAQRYQGFVEKYPSITQRVPQHMIASYLGMTPETLSRVRRQLTSERRKAAGAAPRKRD